MSVDEIGMMSPPTLQRTGAAISGLFGSLMRMRFCIVFSIFLDNKALFSSEREFPNSEASEQ
jgi:hypothetical protein